VRDDTSDSINIAINFYQGRSKFFYVKLLRICCCPLDKTEIVRALNTKSEIMKNPHPNGGEKREIKYQEMVTFFRLEGNALAISFREKSILVCKLLTIYIRTIFKKTVL
jgi:uncharacterized protein YbaR (Trm112 family)